MRTLFAAAVGLLATALLSTSLLAQSFQGSLRGVVKDAQGVIPGASVTMTNEANGVTRDTVTNGVGQATRFIYKPQTDPGVYTPGAAAAYPKRNLVGGSGALVSSMQISLLDIP